MQKLTRKISVVLFSVCLLCSQTANAARMGKSGNSGMQRNVTTNTSTNSNSGYQSNPSSTAGAANAGQAQPKSGVGAGAVVAGAAAGALGGYMLGKASNNHNTNASQTQAASSQSQGSQFPWGLITILGLLLVIGLMIFKRRAAAVPSVNNQGGVTGFPNNMQQQNNNFDIPNVRRDNSNYTPGQYTNQQQSPTAGNMSQPANPVVDIQKMPDGVESQYFLRQAKGMFLHIQSMNTPENVSEVEKYMTPELYLDVKSTITSNDFVADFSQLDCRLLDTTTENAKYIASVLFFGKVSESPTSPVVDFKEIWHFIKPASEVNGKWLVAGIQQVNQA